MDDLHISLAAETLFHIGPIPVTNSMLTMFLVMAGILIVFTIVARKAQAIPGRGQGIVEMIVEFIANLVEGTAGRRTGRRLLPLISGIFIFILFANFSGLLPGVGTIGVVHEDEHAEEETHETDAAATPAAGIPEEEQASEDEDVVLGNTETDGEGGEGAAATEEEAHTTLVPILRPPTADLNMTLAMALLTFTVVQIAGISVHGVVGRIKHMADPPFLFPIEVISELSRIISLSARLFGNVFAGEVLLGVMYAMAAAIKIALIPVLFPIVFIGLEVLFGTIQALVFALLTLIYITLATAGHDDHHEEHAHGHGDDEAAEHPERVSAAPAPTGD